MGMCKVCVRQLTPQSIDLVLGSQTHPLKSVGIVTILVYEHKILRRGKLHTLFISEETSFKRF